MVWDINQINRAFLGEALSSPAAAFDKGRLAAKEERIFDENRQMQLATAQRARQLEAQKQRDQAYLATNPSPQAYAQYYLRYPEDKDAISQSFTTRSEDQQKSDVREMAGIFGHLTAGNGEAARRTLKRRIEADKAAGQDVSDDEEMLASIEQGITTGDYKSPLGAVSAILSAVVGPKEFATTFKTIGEEQRANELQPALVQEGEAKANKATVEAAYTPQTIESELQTEATNREVARQNADVAVENAKINWERLNFDKDKAANDLSVKLQELLQTGQKVEGASLTAMNKAASDAVAAQAQADGADALAARLQASGARGGLGSAWGETIKSITGSQDEVSLIRAQYQQLINSSIINNLPPGVASDRDIMLFSKGFPSSTAPADYVASFLRGMAKVQRAAADLKNNEATWISNNGTLGSAKKNMVIGGKMVLRGTSYPEFIKSSKKADSSKQIPPGLEGTFATWGR